MPRMTIRVSQEEIELIDQKAMECAMTRSQFVRQSAIGVIPRSKFDKKVVHQLFLLHGDIGRLGGLLKLWLSRNEDALMHHKLDIYDLVNEIKHLKKAIYDCMVNL